MIELNKVGAHVGKDGVSFGIYLPEMRERDGYQVRVRVIHAQDQFTAGIEPETFELIYHPEEPLDLWKTEIPMRKREGHFGSPGKYLYRYELIKSGELITWFSDPFAFETGPGTLSAFRFGKQETFNWEDRDFKVPPLEDLVVYELMVAEFNLTFGGVAARLDYLKGLGVNAIELMPVTNIPEPHRWGYMPLNYFAPEDRYGGAEAFKHLVNESHKQGVAVILDAVYAHCHQNFGYNAVYNHPEIPIKNPMMGPFAEDMFGTGTDFSKEFTQQYFLKVNHHWLDEYHVDGFRYDYVPGFYDGPTGVGFAKLTYETYQYVKENNIERFRTSDGHMNIVQCAEHLPNPKGILTETYANTCWQNDLLDKAIDTAKRRYIDDRFAHLLDLNFLSYPDEYENPSTGDRMPVTAFQYIESHDHSRLITCFGVHLKDPYGFDYGDRRNWYWLQPFIIALYTAQGIPMLYQGQEICENYSLPGEGWERVLAKRPLRWEYFYDTPGTGIRELHRKMGVIRRERRALRSRNSYYYHTESDTGEGIIFYLREAPASDHTPQEKIIVGLNFSGNDYDNDFPFPDSGTWRDLLHGETIYVSKANQRKTITIPSHYGKVYLLG